MQRIGFDRQDTSWNSPAETLHAAGRERAQEADKWPTPGELLLETGIVLAVTLGMSVAIDLIMGAI